MRQTEVFTKTRKEAPSGESSKNAELLIRAGFVSKEMAGVYSYLPLGLKVLNKINNIIREEMNSIGGQELLLTTLQPEDKWTPTGRWSDDVLDVWFKTKLHNDTEIGLATTHEEPLTNLMKGHISSYKDLPIAVYQIQTKFRNELRAKSGIMRGREFLMKDLYSFDRNEEDFREFYEKCAESYLRIFEKCGIGDRTFRTFSDGGSFSKFSDEFQTITDAGEDIIYLDRDKKIAVNKEVYNDENLRHIGLSADNLEEVKSVEVANIFPLGTKFSEAIGLEFKDKSGDTKPVFMGSYGIGPGRLMGTVVEVLSDEKGLVWPEAIAPFKVHLVSLGTSENIKKTTEELYKKLSDSGVEVLFDDRDVSPGEKFADSDLLGIPTRVVVSEKNQESGKLEVVQRRSGEKEFLTEKDFLSKFVGTK